MAWIVSKEFYFSASHQLKVMTEGHPCVRFHGHNYVLRLFLAANELDQVGFVRDYKELNFVKGILKERFDHRHLNEVVDFNPTIELLSQHFYDLLKPALPQLVAIEMEETGRTRCRYEPGVNV